MFEGSRALLRQIAGTARNAVDCTDDGGGTGRSCDATHEGLPTEAPHDEFEFFVDELLQAQDLLALGQILVEEDFIETDRPEGP